MSEIGRWAVGIMFGMLVGSYGYTYSAAQNAKADNEILESRISRQLDIIERKVDTVIERQFNQTRRAYDLR